VKIFPSSQKRDIGARVKSLRQKAGLTQEQLARALEMSVSHISKVEVGVGNTSESLLHRLADKLGVSKEWLENGLPAPAPPTAPSPAPAPATHIAEESLRYGSPPLDAILLSRALKLSCDSRIKSAAEGVASALNCPYPEALEIVIRRELEKGQK
jgi:transcriptional regulator with XRE-family HTH domain